MLPIGVQIQFQPKVEKLEFFEGYMIVFHDTLLIHCLSVAI